MELPAHLARNKEERLFIARCLDQVEIAHGKHRPVLTGFLDPGQAALLTQVAAGAGGVQVHTWGGYPDAERVRACLRPADWRPVPPDFEISLLRVSPRVPGGTAPSLCHRDYLGALLGLGLKREKIGDCLVQPSEGVVCLAAEIAGFVEENLTQVGRWTVTVQPVAPGESLPEPPPLRSRTVTAASPRLDAVLGAAFNLSRSRAAALIRAGSVNVNWRAQTNPDAPLRAGDTVSCRGRGRFRVLELAGPTRRGRQRLRLGFPAD